MGFAWAFSINTANRSRALEGSCMINFLQNSVWWKVDKWSRPNAKQLRDKKRALHFPVWIKASPQDTSISNKCNLHQLTIRWVQVHPKNHYYCLFLIVYFTWDPKVSVRTHLWNVLNHDWDARKQLSKEDHQWWPMSAWAERMPAQGDPAPLEPCVRAPVTPEVARAWGGTWSTNAWVSGELMASWCYAPKAAPAFTLLLLALLLPPGGFPLPNAVSTQCLRKCWCILISPAYCACSHQQYGHWCVQAEYHQQYLHGPALALGLGAAAASLQVQQNWLWALCWDQHSQHLLGCRQGSTLPWLPQTPKSLSPTTETENHWHILILSAKVREQSSAFPRRKWKNYLQRQYI